MVLYCVFGQLARIWLPISYFGHFSILCLTFTGSLVWAFARIFLQFWAVLECMRFQLAFLFELITTVLALKSSYITMNCV